jgi:RNA polymerase sigma-32 factor
MKKKKADKGGDTPQEPITKVEDVEVLDPEDEEHNAEDLSGAEGDVDVETLESELESEDDSDDKGDDDFVLMENKDGVAKRDPLHLYLREINRFPLLKPEEEYELAKRVRETGDQEAAFRLVSSHLRLVVKISMDFQRRWMQNVLDLIQEGNVGLMRAVQKFDPEKGIKFSYYAAFWIKAYILKFIMDNWRLVKIGTTQAQRKLFYNLNKERQRLTNLGFDPDISTLSKNLNVSEAEVAEMDQRLSRKDQSLDTTLTEDGTATRLDFLPALEPGIEDILAQSEISGMIREQLESILPELNEKERDILKYRLLSDSPMTLREIGEKYDVTRERVRQIEARLLQKLKKRFTEDIKDFSKDWIREND